MKRLLNICLGIIALLAIIYIVARATDGVPSSDIPQGQQVAEIIGGDCLECHQRDAVIPWYGKLPIISKTIQEDITIGTRAQDYSLPFATLTNGKDFGQVPLNKLEKVVMDGTMPPVKYKAMHWRSIITNKEREIIINWVRDYRAQNYSMSLASDAFANEPVQPIPSSVDYDAAKAELGNKLFHDTRLSIDNTISCASCHNLQTGGVDNKQFSEGIGKALGGVNAPTVYNAYFNFVQFWDGRAKTLADQAAGPPLNPIEMGHTSFDNIVASLSSDKQFKREFLSVYSEISQATITDAIEHFERTLLTPNNKFDMYLKGDDTAINENEKDGYELFKRYDCATCHAGTILGGQSYEYMGTYEDYFDDRDTEITIEDRGRFKESADPYDMHRFKVPGLRNVKLTYPYFHDGTQLTLEDAVEKMLEYQTRYDDVRDIDIQKIVQFLQTI